MGALVTFEILILGPVELRSGGRRDALGTAREGLALAALAVDAGRPVPLDTLIHRLWDDNPPRKPRASLHVYAARIRRRLDSADGDVRLAQQAGSYTLEIDPDQVDLHRFQRLTAEARSLSDAGDDVQALALLEEAEAGWRGEPLSGLPGLWAESVRTNMAEKHLAAKLTRIAVELRMGHFAELIPDLTTLLEQHPTDEGLAGHLMVADYGCGRQADALRVYDTVRRRLSEELGAEPGGALSRLQQLILNQAPVAELLARPEPVSAAPHTLPSHGELVGREREMRALQAPGPGGAVIALQAISGMPGIGKSTLALHAARRLTPSFPSGQVHFDLEAHTPGRSPLTPQAALSALLRIFGVPASEIPGELGELVSLWRTLLATRRAVIVLDDAADAEQVRPLLPGDSPSLVIITSRRRLTGLPGVRSLFLDVMTADEADAMFRQLAGEERSRDQAEVSEITRLCGNLPLAVELAAGRLVSRPSWTTAHLIRRLSREDGRLGEIRDGFSMEIVRAFEMSYHTLPADQRTAFRLLSLHLGPDFDLHAAAALLGREPDESERMLEELLDAHLIREPSPERYAYHDLLREFARTLTTTEDPPAVRDTAVERLIDFYTESCAQADRAVYPHHFQLDLFELLSDIRINGWDDAQGARQWLNDERAALIAAERRSRDHGNPAKAARLAHVLARFLDEEGYWPEAREMHTAAAAHWREEGNRQAEALALIDLGSARSHASDYEHAMEAGNSALDAAAAINDSQVAASAFHLLGVVYWNLGRLDDALAIQEKALELRRRSGDIWQLARCANNLGITHLFRANYSTSLEYFQSALAGFRETADLRQVSHVLNNMSDHALQMGDRDTARKLLPECIELLHITGGASDEATAQVNLADTMDAATEFEAILDLYRQALVTFHRLGDRRNACITLHGMGVAHQVAGLLAEAATHHQRALDLARSIGAAHEEAQALRHLGMTEHRLGRLASARAHLEAAVALADRTGATKETAHALDSLALLCAETGEPDRARALWLRACAAFTELSDTAEVARIAGHLTDRHLTLPEVGRN